MAIIMKVQAGHAARKKLEAALIADITAVLNAILPAGKLSGTEFRVGDVDGKPGDSLSVCVSGKKAGAWIDHATGDSGNMLGLIAARFKLNVGNLDALASKVKQILSSLGDVAVSTHIEKPHSVFQKMVAEWDYLGPNGQYVWTIQRYEDGEGNKSIRPYNKATGQYKAHPEPRPLFNQPGICDADTVLLVEGEKCAQEAIDAGKCATTAMMGAKAPSTKTDWSPLKGKKVWIWPDNDEPGMAYALHSAKAALEAGAIDCTILTIPQGKPQGWDVADAIAEGGHFDLDGFIQDAVKNGQIVSAELVPCDAPVSGKLEDQIVAQLNMLHAVINIGSQTVVMTEATNYKGEKEPQFGTFPDLKMRYANQRIVTCNLRGTEQDACIAEVWIKHPLRRTYSGLVFAPKGTPNGYYNLFDGFPIQPVQGDCSLYLEHLLTNICRGNQEFYDYLLNWMAHAIQFPYILPGVAIVFRGAQGTGKGVATEEFGLLFGRHFAVFTSMAPLIGRFNGHLSDKLVIYINEAVWGGDKAAEGQLKAMITDTHTTVEMKFKDVVRVDSYKRLMFSSNEDWAVPVGKDDRRYFVLDVGSGHKEDHQYFLKIIEQMRNGGSEALMHELMHRDLSGFNVKKMPHTPYSFELKLLSMDSADQFMYEHLRNASSSSWDIYTPKKILHHEYLSWCDSVGKKHKHPSSVFGKRLNKLISGIEEKKQPVATSGELDKRVAHYVFPSLEKCRSDFEKACKSDPDIWKM